MNKKIKIKKKVIKEKKNEKEKNDDIIEDNIEKYFDKNGNCIGGRKIIIFFQVPEFIRQMKN